MVKLFLALFSFAKECLSDSKDDFNIKSEKFKTSKVILGVLFSISVIFNYTLAKRIINLNAIISAQTAVVNNTEQNITNDMLSMDLKACKEKNDFYALYIKDKCNKNTSTTLSDVSKQKIKVTDNGR